MNLPFVSVVIPTYERNFVLCDTINEVLKQDYPNFEIIVADQTQKHSSDAEKFLQALKNEKKVNRIILPVPSTTRSKNIAIKAAKGEIVLILDDDVLIPSVSFIQNHVKMYRDETVGGVAGKIINGSEKSLQNKAKHILKNIYEFCYDGLADPTRRKYKNYRINGRFAGKILPTGAFVVNQDLIGEADIEVFAGANSSFRKRVLEEIGLFDETFRGNAHREESDLSLRVIKHGYKIIYTGEAEIIHLMSLRGGSRSRIGVEWYSDYFFNNAYFFYKHFNSLLTPFLFLHLVVKILRAIKDYKFKALTLILSSVREGYTKAKKPTSL
jgi:GT2 family glycosyltransferase